MLGACIVRIGQVEVEPLSRGHSGTPVTTPVKAHLLDGSTVVYLTGVSIAADSLRGLGTRYDLRLREVGAVSRLPLDSVAGMANFRTGTNVPASVALTIAAHPSARSGWPR